MACITLGYGAKGIRKIKCACFWTSRCVWSWPQPGIYPHLIIPRLQFSEQYLDDRHYLNCSSQFYLARRKRMLFTFWITSLNSLGELTLSESLITVFIWISVFHLSVSRKAAVASSYPKRIMTPSHIEMKLLCFSVLLNPDWGLFLLFGWLSKCHIAFRSSLSHPWRTAPHYLMACPQKDVVFPNAFFFVLFYKYQYSCKHCTVLEKFSSRWKHRKQPKLLQQLC